jgi:cytochrome d ubiquinol oxidase subunit I
MALSGWLAVLAGWYTTEIGRQPWLVTGVLSTAEAVADVPAPMVLSTLIAYLAVYAVLTGAYVAVIVYLAWKATRGETLPTRGGMPPSEAAIERVVEPRGPGATPAE